MVLAVKCLAYCVNINNILKKDNLYEKSIVKYASIINLCFAVIRKETIKWFFYSICFIVKKIIYEVIIHSKYVYYFVYKIGCRSGLSMKILGKTS